MELPEHSCVNCTHLYIDASKPISYSERKKISGKNWNSKYFSFDYFRVTCFRSKLERFSTTAKSKQDIHTEITKGNECREWLQFSEGISATDAEHRRFTIQSTNLAKWSIIIAILALIVSIIALICSLVSYDS